MRFTLSREDRPDDARQQYRPMMLVAPTHASREGDIFLGVQDAHHPGTMVFLSNDEARALALHLLGVTKPAIPGGYDPEDYAPAYSPLTVNRLSSDGKTVRVERATSVLDELLRREYLPHLREQFQMSGISDIARGSTS